MLNPIYNKLVYFSIIILIFDNIPKPLQMNFISNGMSTKLTWYFLFALSAIVVFTWCRNGFSILREERWMIRYMLFLIATSTLSNIISLFTFNNWHIILNGPMGQISRIPMVYAIVQTHGIPLDYAQLISVWLGSRALKTSILGVAYTFGFSFILYYVIKNEWGKYYNLLITSILISVFIICGYSIVESFYLAGNKTATYLLTVINPLIHPIAVDHNWWPPLLWKNQLRSVFSEPSRMGNYVAFALPFMWIKLLQLKRSAWKIGVLLMVLTFFIFLTKARTPIGMYWGLLLVFTLLGVYYYSFSVLKRMLLIFIVTGIAFSASLGFINTFMVTNHNNQVSASEYMDNNIGSLTSSKKRSNGARYALLRANFITGAEHPVLGAGSIFTPVYTVNHFSEEDLQNREVNMWVDNYYKEGPLKYGLSAMNEYVTRFAQYGLVGLILFLIPPFFVLAKLLKKLKYTSREEKDSIFAVVLALIGTLVAGCNGSLTLLYTYWIVLAYAYAIVYGTYKSQISEEYHHEST